MEPGAKTAAGESGVLALVFLHASGVIGATDVAKAVTDITGITGISSAPAIWPPYTRKLLSLIFEILHVASAESYGGDLLVTGDKRQFKRASAVGQP
jgi:hypothetical protein